MYLLKLVNEEQIRLIDLGFTFGFWLLSPYTKNVVKFESEDYKLLENVF